MDNSLFDVVSYFDSRGVRYWSKGNNVPKGNVNVRCLWCDDRSNHMTIYPKGNMYCWRCLKSGSITKLVMEIENCFWNQAEDVQRQFLLGAPRKGPGQDFERVPVDDFVLPKEFSDTIPRIHRAYLESRRFDPEYLQKEFGIKACHNQGDFKFRVIAPIFSNGKVVNYVGRDVTDKAYLRYKMCPDEEAAISRREVLYNLDSVGDTALIFEGVTDVWRLGAAAIATLSVAFTAEQATLLRRRGVKRFFIGYDEGAESQMERLDAKIFWTDEVYYLDFPKGVDDPAELSDDDVRHLRNEIF